jgi:hypothetical protein
VTDEAADDTRCIKRALRCSVLGSLSRAVRNLWKIARPPPTDAVERLRALHPDGPNPQGPTLLNRQAAVSEDELRIACFACCSGASPGASGIADEVWQVLALDRACRHGLCHLLLDVVNNEVAPSVRDVLVRSRLVALGKPDGGTRPIAIGETLLKLASRVAFGRCDAAIRRHFAPLQRGVLEPRGLEQIVHTCRAHLREGKALMTIDCRNAFNSPHRTFIHDELVRLPFLQPLAGLFDLEYGRPSELCVFEAGVLVHTLLSRCGTRQGSLLGGFFFALVLHPILLRAAARFPDVYFGAYLDDITVAGTPAQCAEVFAFLAPELAAIGLEVNTSKCEFLDPAGSPCPIPTVRQVHGAIKVLGSYVGTSDDVESAILLRKVLAHTCLFRRCRLLAASPFSILTLSLSVLPRVSSYLRTHHPDATRAMAEAWDIEVRKCVFDLAAAVPSEDAWFVASLPLRLGGLGLVEQAAVAQFAFAASADSALRPQHRSPFSTPQPAQKDATDDLHSTRAAAAPEHLRPLLAENSARGAFDWLTYDARTSKMGRRACSAALRLRLGAVSPLVPATKRCPGCAREFPNTTFEYHASSCVTLGVPVMKHNSVRDLMERFALEAGHDIQHEPREYQAFRCRSCGDVITKAAVRTHGCTGQADRTGVDFRVLWPEGAAVYDVTVLQTLAPSYRASDPDTVAAATARNKHTIYDDQCASNNESLAVLCLRAAGGLCNNIRTFVQRCAQDRVLDFPHLIFKEEVRRMCVELSVQLQRFNGECVATGIARHRLD